MRIIDNKQRINSLLIETGFQSFFSHDISKIVELIYAENGEILIKEGTPSNYLYYIVQGQCRYYTVTADGTYISFGVSKNDMFFGQASSLWNEKPTANVQAITDIFCLVINLSKYRSLLQNDVKFLSYNCKLLTKMVNNLDNTLSSYISGGVKERLASFILQNSKNAVFSISLVACSNALGTSYRHLQRIMKYFCDNKILLKEKRKYTILNSKYLESIASDSYVYFY